MSKKLVYNDIKKTGWRTIVKVNKKAALTAAFHDIPAAIL
jgi:hypothetical protein